MSKSTVSSPKSNGRARQKRKQPRQRATDASLKVNDARVSIATQYGNFQNFGSAVPRSIGSLSQMLRTSQRYQDQFLASSTSGVTATYSFRTNSMFDPNYTTTGHQPMYFDQWAAFYSVYKVLRVRMKITLLVTTSFQQVNCTLVTNQSNNGAPGFVSADLFTSAEEVGSDIFTVGAQNPVTIEHTLNVREFLGVKTDAAYIGDLSYDTATNTNPVPTTWLTIMWLPCDGSSTVALNATVQFDFDCVYRQLKIVAQS